MKPTTAELAYFKERLIERGFAQPNECPIKCACGSIHLRCNNGHRDQRAYEYEVVCTNCGEVLARWYCGTYHLRTEAYLDIMNEVTNVPTTIGWALKALSQKLIGRLR